MEREHLQDADVIGDHEPDGAAFVVPASADATSRWA